MDHFGTFVLFFAALIGTVFFITSLFKTPLKKKADEDSSQTVEEPAYEYRPFTAIESESELDEETKEKNKKGLAEVVAKGCSSGCGCGGFIYTILFTYIVEPVALYFAFTNKIGNQYLALAICLIVGLHWIYRTIISIRRKKFVSKIILAGSVVNEENKEKIRAAVKKYNDKISPVRNLCARIFFSIPLFYMWYLFFEIVRVIDR